MNTRTLLRCILTIYLLGLAFALFAAQRHTTHGPTVEIHTAKGILR